MKDYKIDRWLAPVRKFMSLPTAGGFVLIFCTVIALIWANSPWQESYFAFWHQSISISIGNFKLEHSLGHWINDGLMVIFFFVVGLELKKEILVGELSSPKKALLPLIAAGGGMIVPALIFMYYNPKPPEFSGWGIPMATDIAFVIGIVSILGKRVPLSLKIFLTALAVADDLGAVLVIAFFYTSEISFISLAIGGVFFLILLWGNYVGIRSTIFYAVIGICGLWLAFLMSGVHATIAGVLAAFTIPASTKITSSTFAQHLKQASEKLLSLGKNSPSILDDDELHVAEETSSKADEANTPLQRLEHAMSPWVSFFVMPVFALASAGVTINSDMFTGGFFNGITMGVFLGLLLGKLIGVFVSTWLTVKLNIGSLPQGMTTNHLIGAGLLAGIGFTMSMFVAGLAYSDDLLVTEAKIGIFAGSLTAGTLGYCFLRFFTKPN
jgi:NhaA family Na+:H+ antiporter